MTSISATRPRLRRVMGTVASLFVVGCVGSLDRTAPFFAAGQEYRLQMTVTTRPTLIPERAAALGPLQDSVTGTLTVESVVGDSAFGRYQVDLLHLGVMAVPVAPAEPLFAAVVEGDSVTMRLNPNVTDAGVYLAGRKNTDKILGAWHADQGAGIGTFVLSSPR